MSHKHLDDDILAVLREVMEDGYPLLLDTYLNDSELRLAHLRTFSDTCQLREAAHSFKGSSSNMGALRLAQLCGQLETQATRFPAQDIEALVERIAIEFAEVRRLFQEERQRFAIEHAYRTSSA